MNPITQMLNDLKFRIPSQVLDIGFTSSTRWSPVPVSLDEQIMLKVIRPRVLRDCNLVGGQMALVSLEGLLPHQVDPYTQVYQIPKDRTQNRSILSALSVNYFPHAAIYGAAGVNYGIPGASGSSMISGAGQRVGDAVSSVPPVSVGSVELIGENTILFRDAMRITQAYFLRCILENDEGLNSLSPRSYPAFFKLCEFAVKSYLYNLFVIQIDQAYLQGGQELGAFKQYIESLADAEELYQTHLKEVWQAVAFVNDFTSHQRFLKLQVSPAL